MIHTQHIRAMLTEALEVAADLEGRAHDRDEHDDTYVLTALEWAASLARHAAAELDDERLRARDGWSDPIT